MAGFGGQSPIAISKESYRSHSPPAFVNFPRFCYDLPVSEEDVRNYLAGKAGPSGQAPVPPRMKVMRRRPPKPPKEQQTYKDFSATHLFCATCKQAMPVKERLMLYLPDGNLFGYFCERCGNSAGTRKA